MSERLSTQEITYHLNDVLTGVSPIVAVLAWLPPNRILLGRGSQLWLITIEEIPYEK